MCKEVETCIVLVIHVNSISFTDWVMQLGPVSLYDGQELYSYSLVSEPSGRALYVLCRDPEEFADLYEADVLAWLANNGFDKVTNNPVAMYQGSDCLYPELP
jgi:lipocalin